MSSLAAINFSLNAFSLYFCWRIIDIPLSWSCSPAVRHGAYNAPNWSHSSWRSPFRFLPLFLGYRLHRVPLRRARPLFWKHVYHRRLQTYMMVNAEKGQPALPQRCLLNSFPLSFTITWLILTLNGFVILGGGTCGESTIAVAGSIARLFSIVGLIHKQIDYYKVATQIDNKQMISYKDK